MKTRCLIVDDEPLAIEVIKAHVNRLEELEVVATCTNAVQAFEILRQKPVDLLFLDIQMPRLTGIDFLRSITRPPKVIFTTAYRDYAIEAYELDVIDYLLKPISFERFLKAVNKYYHQLAGENTQTIQSNPPHTSTETSYIYVKADKKVQKIFLHEILYIESLKDYLRIHTEHKKIITKESISHFEEKLPTGQFLRIHRSFIVHISKITAFSANSVEINDLELPLGRSYKNTVLKALNYHPNRI